MAGQLGPRDALLAEVLGDAGLLLDRMEALKVSLPELADAVAERIATAGETAANRVGQAGEQARAKIAKAADEVTVGVNSAAGDAREAARTVAGSAGRFTFLALLMGLLGGVAGGAILTLIIVYGTHAR